MAKTPEEALETARRTLKQTAGRQLARKEAHEAEAERLEAELARWTKELAVVREAGSPELDAEITETLQTLREALARAREEAQAAELDLERTRRDLADSAGLERQLERARLVGRVRATTDEDPYAPSATSQALENVRANIEALDARAEVLAEMATDRPSPAQAEDARRLRAEAELERLKAARAQQRRDAPSMKPTASSRDSGAALGDEPGAAKGDDPGAASGDEDPAPRPARRKPKRTL